MKFLPYERFKIRTLLSGQEVLKRLDNVIEPKQHFRFFRSRKKPYEGEIQGSHFEVSRIISNKNSFLPVIKGDIETGMNGCYISISMQTSIFVTVFIIIWLGVAGFSFLHALASFISSLAQASTTLPTSLLPSGGMFGFGYVLVLVGFKSESVQSKKFFQELFKAEEVDEIGFAKPF